MISHQPIPADVRTGEVVLGGVPSVEVTVGETGDATVLLYFHGGAYAVGSAADGVGLVSDIARRAGSRAYCVEYRLAPENPYPAAVDDALVAYRGLIDAGVDPASVAVVGESAGGGLALALLLRIRDLGLPLPAVAAVLSPWADLTMSGASLAGKAQADPALTAHALALRARSYLADADPATAYASPALADLRGLPPLLIQAGSAEILLDDAIRLAARAAADDVAVTLEVVPGAPHVFQAFAGVLDEAAAALDHVGEFLRAHQPRHGSHHRSSTTRPPTTLMPRLLSGRPAPGPGFRRGGSAQAGPVRGPRRSAGRRGR
jgi:acetyl esterase/lipase